MKWLKSTTMKSYSLAGKVVPQCVTSDNKWLALSDSDYAAFAKNAVIASLINAGAILVTETEPSSPTQQVSKLTNEMAHLIRENTELKEKLKAAEDGSAVQAELDSTKAELEAMTAKYNALEKEAKETIANLKKQLKEATKE